MTVDHTEGIQLENTQLRFPERAEYHLYNTGDPRLLSVSPPPKNSRDQLMPTLECAWPFKRWEWKKRMNFDPSLGKRMAIAWVSD